VWVSGRDDPRLTCRQQRSRVGASTQPGCGVQGEGRRGSRINTKQSRKAVAQRVDVQEIDRDPNPSPRGKTAEGQGGLTGFNLDWGGEARRNV